MLSILLLAVISALSTASAEPPFRISIVPESRSGQVSKIGWGAESKRKCYVVLTNTTDQPQRVFETWNSWGYQAISFELTHASGKTSKVSVKPQIFTVNFPSTFTIPANGHYVFPISLNQDWEGEPEFGKEGRTEVKLKAVYGLAPTTESREQEVWTGRVESDELAVEISRR
ncbi:MAG: hypothetical protein ACR2RV_01635 [Verrucomicrobiales bacterium]